MDKMQELARAVLSLAKSLEQQNKIIENYTKVVKDNTEAIRELKTRLGGVANAIVERGNVVETK